MDSHSSSSDEEAMSVDELISLAKTGSHFIFKTNNVDGKASDRPQMTKSTCEEAQLAEDTTDIAMCLLENDGALRDLVMTTAGDGGDQCSKNLEGPHADTNLKSIQEDSMIGGGFLEEELLHEDFIDILSPNRPVESDARVDDSVIGAGCDPIEFEDYDFFENNNSAIKIISNIEIDSAADANPPIEAETTDDVDSAVEASPPIESSLANDAPPIPETENAGEGLQRKSVPDPQQWRRNVSKKNREKGEAYLGFSQNKKNNFKVENNVQRKARKIGPTCSSEACKKKQKRDCASISPEQREELFRQFWKEMSWDSKKRMFAPQFVSRKPNKKDARITTREAIFLSLTL